MSGSQWFYSDRGQQAGPVNSSDLRRLVRKGYLQPTDLVWKQGLDDWVPAAKIKGLFPEAKVPVHSGKQDSPGQTHSPPAKPRSSPRKKTTPPQPARPALDSEPDISLTRLPEKILPKKKKIKLDPKHAANQLYAGFWVRFVAHIIDNIIRQIISGALVGGGLSIFFIFMKSAGVSEPVTVIIGMAGSIPAYVLLNLFYDVFQETSDTQATMGKVMVGLVVTDREGNPIDLNTAVIRHFSKYLSGLLFCGGYIMVAIDENKQGLHDRVAGTLVMHRSK